MEHKKNSTHRVLFIVAGLFLPLFCIILTDEEQSASFMHNDSMNALGRTHFIVGCPLKNIPDTQDIPRTQPASYEYDTIPLNQDGHVCSALFAPDDKWYETLLSLIEREKKRIRVAVYLLTDKYFAQALCAAKARGVVVEVITDPGCARDKSNKLALLHEAGIPVYIYKPKNNRGLISNLMHHKFILFDQCAYNRPIVWTGSANCTQSAASHQENILIVDDKDTYKQYSEQFKKLKKRSILYSGDSTLFVFARHKKHESFT